ncbi:hypothetical protein LTR53_016657 [Teratosphaeriaceae sp. CCFEE 6253]|nr:hypothetical protein LTR53_016657 [Teratosphaeriaceae sp. CCFEE 6253]
MGGAGSRSSAAGFQPLGSSTPMTAPLPAPTPALAAREGGPATTADSRSSRGLTRVGRHYELDRGASLNLAARAMKLKLGTKGLGEVLRQREVSGRNPAGGAEGVVDVAAPTTGQDGKKPWWKNVTPEEGV